ncbi:D-alanine--poly(phosphoribitol) ligase subunit DltA [Clostridium sp. C2-6-12]|uniref:D-alanine--poly(phosphoribitol) ligase subunit DltA n=1 Tax=Clostridium sp. C2-6-12 TaxID=2698832 RepID=UPI00136BC34F|nr:D-alanine--poly(phosphoribitol) ligase subunit DltA [Clostridium sp. C2-6-12]
MKILESIDKFASTERVAVKCLEKELTYKQLSDFSNKIATFLLEEFKEDRTPIVVYGNKENEILPIMMGALKSGRAYVPLDISFPADRISQVIGEVKPKIVFNCTEYPIEANGAQKFNLEEINNIFNSEIAITVKKENWVQDEDNCYILFTSGSTGKPKGVQINKRNLDSFISWFEKDTYMDESSTVMLNQPAYSFDLSVVPLYLGLCNGKTLFSLAKSTLQDLREMFNQLAESDVECWVSTPTLADICCKFDDFNGTVMNKISKFIFIGEVLTKNTAKTLIERFPNAKVINAYGPTEATVAISVIDIDEKMIEDEKELPIGYPMPNCELRIEDEQGNNLSDGEKGELVIIGDSVSIGYLNNPEMTNKAFFQTSDNRQGYRTGDLGYYDNGILYYSGRKDFQIKLNGFRIEIEDIENNFRKLENINNVAVLPVFNEDNKISHLTAFVVLNVENDLSNLKNATLIKNELKKFIPEYMIPRNIKILKQFPQNTNGKIDRKKLMEDLR